MTTTATAPTNALACEGNVGIRRTICYRVRRRDLASTIYRCLGRSRWKPAVLATARLVWLAELAVMEAIPGVSLGVKLDRLEHRGSAVRGSLVTVTAECTTRRDRYRDAECTERRDRYWEWDVVVRDADEVIARCTLGFVSEFDVSSYTERRLAPKLAARPTRVRWWLRFLDALAIALVAVSPLQVVYAWHSWSSILAVETALIGGWLLTLTGLPLWVSDWLTVRPAAGGHRGARRKTTNARRAARRAAATSL